ncbi:MAG: sensor histidine kinase [Planctomycetota bacterium]|jgi:signal transduction histidine kinase
MKLAAKLVSVVMLAIILLVVVNGLIGIRRQVRVFEQDANADATAIGDAMEEMIAEAWRERGEAGVAELIREASEQQSEQQHGIRIRFVYFDAEIGDPYCPAAPRERISAILVQRELLIWAPDPDGTEYLHAYWPVSMSGPRKGGLELSRPTTELSENQHRVIYQLLVQMAATVIVAGVVTVLMGVGVVGRPLRRLIEKTRRAAAGDLSGPLHLNTHDELAELAESMNHMCEKLAESQTTICEEAAARIAAMEQLRHADRLKTVGRLASGMAHELGTPLSVVAGRAGLIASGKLSKEEVAASADAIKAEADKMTTIIRQLLDFARRRSPRKASVDLRRVTGQTVDLLFTLAEKQKVTLELANHGEPAAAVVDIGQIQQVLTNLIINAIQAMPDGGRVELSIRRGHVKPPEGVEAAEGEYLCVSVKDDGVGISEETRRQLFEPFFTTKDVGEGTGLGLSIAYGIVQEHGGWIDVTSEPGKGSCFTVYLPQETAR